MPFWSKKPKDASSESAEQTLARLQSSATGPTEAIPATRGHGNPAARIQRGGYNITEVDQFLATIDKRTVDEINNVRFHASRHQQGYKEDDIDQLLDTVVAERATGKAPSTDAGM